MKTFYATLITFDMKVTGVIFVGKRGKGGVRRKGGKERSGGYM